MPRARRPRIVAGHWEFAQPCNFRTPARRLAGFRSVMHKTISVQSRTDAPCRLVTRTAGFWPEFASSSDRREEARTLLSAMRSSPPHAQEAFTGATGFADRRVGNLRSRQGRHAGALLAPRAPDPARLGSVRTPRTAARVPSGAARRRRRPGPAGSETPRQPAGRRGDGESRRAGAAGAGRRGSRTAGDAGRLHRWPAPRAPRPPRAPSARHRRRPSPRNQRRHRPSPRQSAGARADAAPTVPRRAGEAPAPATMDAPAPRRGRKPARTRRRRPARLRSPPPHRRRPPSRRPRRAVRADRYRWPPGPTRCTTRPATSRNAARPRASGAASSASRARSRSWNTAAAAASTASSSRPPRTRSSNPSETGIRRSAYVQR